ncbi:hypothetical protein LOTGIDRAFT_231487 [Lottia gigantea]|uniref:Uncharacterized protein n=1 Tax=Lottia gigantea TaxID=225164 RepID=V4AR26_LOTGI|nr:hypothetical protein LOTGIDRAFT_231487 [Lottia gigantea]ESO97280.1 hypothetical protein LOTGIDRAFT_231487 [Lottia gigantea]
MELRYLCLTVIFLLFINISCVVCKNILLPDDVNALSYRVCTNDDIPTMQTECEKENKAFSRANRNDNHTEICRMLYQMWFCVAHSVPQCFQNYTFFYQSYLHSPHNCKPSPEQLLKLQSIRKEALDRIEVVTIETSTIPTDDWTDSGHVTDKSDQVTVKMDEEGEGGSEGSKQGGHSSHTGKNTARSIGIMRKELAYIFQITLSDIQSNNHDINQIAFIGTQMRLRYLFEYEQSFSGVFGFHSNNIRIIQSKPLIMDKY